MLCHAGLLSHDVDADDKKSTMPYKATNFFGSDEDNNSLRWDLAASSPFKWPWIFNTLLNLATFQVLFSSKTTNQAVSGVIWGFPVIFGSFTPTPFVLDQNQKVPGVDLFWIGVEKQTTVQFGWCGDSNRTAVLTGLKSHNFLPAIGFHSHWYNGKYVFCCHTVVESQYVIRQWVVVLI